MLAASPASVAMEIQGVLQGGAMVGVTVFRDADIYGNSPPDSPLNIDLGGSPVLMAGMEVWSNRGRSTFWLGVETMPLFVFNNGSDVAGFGAGAVTVGPTWGTSVWQVGPCVTAGVFLFGAAVRLFYLDQKERSVFGLEMRLGYLYQSTYTVQFTARFSTRRRKTADRLTGRGTGHQLDQVNRRAQ